MDNNKKMPRRIAQAVINSLKGGVVPRVGLPYVTVGRKHEIEAMLRDIEIVGEGGASFRFIMGRYGSGKSFLMQTIRNYAMERGFAVCDADLSPERRLQGTRGQGLATYRELMRNLATRTRPEGGALMLAIDKWISGVEASVAADGVETGSDIFRGEVERKIFDVIRSMDELVHGFDFARVLTLYCRSYWSGDDETKGRVMKWLRGEYKTKSEARAELGVNVIITDDDWYEYLKLFAFFFCLAGYRGMLVLIDELVNIYRIPNTVTRNNNYEKILTMYNDAMQGKAHHIGIIMSGTPECVEDRRRGVYNYEALRSRLTAGKFAGMGDGMRDMLAPVICLDPLTPEEMMVLAEKLRDIHAGLYGCDLRIDENDLASFIKIEYARVGASRKITPREIIRDFIELLDILYQHPEKSAEEILGSDEFKYADTQEGDAGEFADFTI